MLRKLVSIRNVKEVLPIEGADFIELVKIDGWQCVVKKGEFKEGDYCIYFEIDSFLPIEERYEFLRKSSYKQLPDGTEGFRLKTMKLRKKLSQGLALPTTLFKEIDIDHDIEIDIAEKLNVIKYEQPIPAQLSGTVKGMFPSFISKSDQERIQNLPEYFEQYKDIEFEESEKCDGTSGTFFYNNGEFGVCSRNLELKEDVNNTFWKIINDTKIKESLEILKINVGIQGEVVGEGIQKNTLKIKGQDFLIYNIYDIDKMRYMTPDERKDFIKKLDNDKIKQVPIINERIKIFTKFTTMDSLINYAEGNSLINKEGKREGIIFKSYTLDNNNIISFKVINNKYLLKVED